MRREFARRGHGLCLTWSACLAAFAGLAAYDVTGEQSYLDAVDLIARYVKSNQNLDESDRLRYGSFVVSRDRRFVDVPDLSWAGDLFVHLHRRTGDADYLHRAMPHGGFTTFYLLDKEQGVAYSHGSDGQHGIFLADIHEETKDDRYARPLKPLAEMLSGPGQHESGAYYASLRADGTPVFEGWDEEAGHPLIDGIEKIVTGPRQNYYAARFLIEQYRRDGDSRFLESARRCAQWTVDLYREHGYIPEWLTLDPNATWQSDGTADVASPGAMTRVWLALHAVDGDEGWLEACREVSEWSLRWQRNQPQHPDLNGAIIARPPVVAYHVSFAAWGLIELAARLSRRG
jgi:uncharacterized protein YyaL (SSP411 family)